MAFGDKKKKPPAPPAHVPDDRDPVDAEVSKLMRAATPGPTPDRRETPEGNFTPRALIAIINDNSGSVIPHAGEVQTAWDTLAATLKRSTLTAVSVEIGAVFCNDDLKSIPFTSAAVLKSPTLEFGGRTPLGAAIEVALDQLTVRLRALAEEGIPVTKKAIAIISDEYPTDDTARAVERLHEFEAKEKLNIFPFAVGAASIEFLNRLSRRTKAAIAKGNDYAAIYSWLAALATRISQSRLDEPVENPPLPSGFVISR